ncbi:MAG: hypothetical protein LC792_10475 [Actinobacteria bacterium]|nr:hypothetical protein [Actinomycetota bacterium]
MSRRGWSAAAIVIAMTVGLAAPARAAETIFDDTCTDVYGHRPVGDLEKSTDPVAGSTVGSGEGIQVSLSWPTFGVAGERPSRVIECLSIDGGSPRLWAERRFTTADGTVSLSTVVPDGLGPKSTLCGQSFLKTKGPFGPVSRWSEKTCFPAAKDGSFQALSRIPSESSHQPESRSTPTTRGPLFAPPHDSWPTSRSPSPPSGGHRNEYEAPWPPWEKSPRVSASPPVTSASTSTTTTTTTSNKAVPRKAQGSQSAAPATAPTRAPSQTLPRTGAGIVVLLGVAGVALFSGRTLRKTAHHIEDSMPVDAVPVDDEEPTLVLGRRW